MIHADHALVDSSQNLDDDKIPPGIPSRAAIGAIIENMR